MHLCFKIVKFLLQSMSLEDANNTKLHGKATDEGHNSVQNM
jgi:hypothetical protein